MRDSTFEAALAVVHAHEGGFADGVADRGGPTHWGISLRFLRRLGDQDDDGWLDGDLDQDGDVDTNDVRRLSRDQADQIYFDQWWRRYRYDQLRPYVASKLFDTAVNMGHGRAARLLQRALRASLRDEVIVDGRDGPITRRAASEVDAFELLAAWRASCEGFYRSIVARDPAQVVHLRGWIRRAHWPQRAEAIQWIARSRRPMDNPMQRA